MVEKYIEKYIESISPLEKKDFLIGPVDLIKYLAPRYPELAADTVLRRELGKELDWIVNESLNLLNEKASESIYRTFIEIALNLVGLEIKRIQLPSARAERIFKTIVNSFKNNATPSILELAIGNFLNEMKQVTKGNSLVAKMAENIQKKLDPKNLAESFFEAIKFEIQNNIYYRMAEKKMSKFGNDSATGLRMVRHFDFVQVSSNPVIAARAFQEFPVLWNNFEKIIQTHPHWQEDPEKYGDEIVLHGTIVSLLPNLLVFRPIALLSNFHDGLVSYQLNPFKAKNSRATIKDAEKICAILRKILYHYDWWLGWDPDRYQGRPNIVFKIAACSPAAIKTTLALNQRGIGTNNTVTYSVSQELRLLVAEAEGMAQALKTGILPSQVYQTNMIGRTEDHLREDVAERLVAKLSQQSFEKLAQAICPEAGGSRKKRTKIICSKRYLKSLADQRLVKALTEIYGKETSHYLSQLEDDIEQAGIFVTRRVYKLFFAPENRVKWKRYLQKKYELSEVEAEIVLDRIDLLPASKRRARDTYLVLGTPNVTNTEFPNHQLEVWLASRKEDFNLEKFRESIKSDPDSEILARLLSIKDFIKVYELSPSLRKLLNEVGIEGNFGHRGMEPEDWPKYGAAIKTMTEFKNAYLNFKQKAIKFILQTSSN